MITEWNSATSANAHDATLLPLGGIPAIVWLRMTNDGTTRRFLWSMNGQHWLEIKNFSNTYFLTSAPDQVGFWVTAQSSTWPVATTLLSWKEQ